MNLDQIHRIYFIGIGGIGMSALARYFLADGKTIAGYDRVSTPLTRTLEEEGIQVHYEDDARNIPPPFTSSRAGETLVVYTPAIPAGHKELNFFRQGEYTVVKRSEVLGWLSAQYHTLAVAGSHGKTTVSTMLAHILSHDPKGCVALLGGISKDHHSNLIRREGAEILVAEADEYDRSFLQLSPAMAIITAMDADHLDIYGNKEQMIRAYAEFAGKLPPGGSLLLKQGLEPGVLHGRKKYHYRLDPPADFYVDKLRIDDGIYHFDLVAPMGRVKDLSLGLPGRVNVENAVAAVGMALLHGIKEETIRKALHEFSGVVRRFDFRIRTPQLVYMDDYAHHPEELRACIRSVRELYPGRRITGIFQPHLFSRTRDLAPAFAESLDLLDRLLLLEIYPARENPIPGVSSEMIIRHCRLPDKMLCKKSDLLGIVQGEEVDILLSLGAGDIDSLVEPLEKLLHERIKRKNS